MGALDGLKILDFSTLLPGPYATMLLADLGAEVLKVSVPSRPEFAVSLPPFLEEEPTMAANQAWLNRNKKTMLLELGTEEGVRVVKRLIQEYDIVLEQSRPGSMEKLGLDYKTLSKVNPRLIYCSLTGYGQTGPMRLRAGHDINYLARSGNMAHAGRRDTGPVLTDIQIADVAVGSMNAVIAILAAAWDRQRTGQGQYLDISMLDGLVSLNSVAGAAFLVNGREPRRESEILNGGYAYDFYETKDGEYLSVGAVEPKFWHRFCQAIGCQDLSGSGIWSKTARENKDRIREIIKGKTRAEWMAVFEELDACVEPVLSVGEALLEDEQVRAREMVVDVELPLRPGTYIKQLADPIKMSRTAPEYHHSGYPLGYHTEEILKRFGYSSEEVQVLKEKKII